MWKAHSLITSCSPASQHRGGDKQTGSSGGVSGQEQHRAEQVSGVALPLANRVIASALEKTCHMYTARNCRVAQHIK